MLQKTKENESVQNIDFDEWKRVTTESGQKKKLVQCHRKRRICCKVPKKCHVEASRQSPVQLYSTMQTVPV